MDMGIAEDVNESSVLQFHNPDRELSLVMVVADGEDADDIGVLILPFFLNQLLAYQIAHELRSGCIPLRDEPAIELLQQTPRQRDGESDG
jgi:hypothetical protein